MNLEKTNDGTVDFFLQNELDFVVLVTSGAGSNGSSLLASDQYRQNALNSIAAYLKRVNAGGI